MLQENILKQRELAGAINMKVQKILSKFSETKNRDCCDSSERIEPRTLIDYQKEINYDLDETFKSLNILEEIIGD